MPSATANDITLYFDEPRLHMTVVGRVIVRVVTYVAYFVFIAAAVTGLISQIPFFFFLSIFAVLIFIDQWVHRGEGDVPIGEFPKHGKINVAKAFRPQALTVLTRAADRSSIGGKPYLLEVASRLLEMGEIEEGLERLDISVKEFKEKMGDLMREATPAGTGSRVEYFPKSSLLAMEAFQCAVSNGRTFVTVQDLFAGLANVHDGNLDRIFQTFGVDAGDLERALIFGSASSRRKFGRLPFSLGGFTLDAHKVIPHRIMNRAWTSRPTPVLDRYSKDLTDLARGGHIGFMIGHDEEFDQLVETLSRPINPNVILVGEAGIGKETIVAHLAFCLAHDHVPKNLFDKRLVSLDIQGLVAGAPPDELNKRLKEIVDEIYAAENVILYIPDIHNLVKTSGTAYLSRSRCHHAYRHG
jgi:ATP-dependent Clp protease ATP-binding subunit ClpA